MARFVAPPHLRPRPLFVQFLQRSSQPNISGSFAPYPALTTFSSHKDKDIIGNLTPSAEFLDDDLEEFELDLGPEVNTCGLPWAETALQVAYQVLSETKELELFSLQVVSSAKRIDVRLDKLTDEYGSPTLDEIESFSTAFNAALEEALGAEAAGEIEIEMSSPGAERRLRIPRDLERFAHLPMKVEYALIDGSIESKVLNLGSYSDDSTEWSLADVGINRPGKGRPLSRKQRQQVFEIPVSMLRRVNLFIDV